MPFPKIDPKQNFPKMEEEILEFWQREKIFEKSLARNPAEKEFKFFDGPPFATGLPHYGHILQGVIKDLIPRYKTMRGFRVPRIWGWDCHGLPVENLIEKELNLSSKKEIEDFGVAKFNEKCRESVLKFADEWKKTVARMGRWIEMEHAYKTMDAEFMDSVWWVFGELWKKDLIYEGLKPMHVCPRCATPLSNFEVGLNYRDATDLSAIAKFELDDEKNTFLLAWTTTPWTLPGNVALAVNPDEDYVEISTIGFSKHPVKWNEGDKIILATKTASKIFPGFTKTENGNKTVIGEEWKPKYFKGSELVGKKYRPLFEYFAGEKSAGAFRIVAGMKPDGESFVNTEEGTGIVHIAPAFGEDDYNLKKIEDEKKEKGEQEFGLPIIQHVSLDGNLVPEIAKDFENKKVKFQKSQYEPDKLDLEIVKKLEKENLIFDSKPSRHSYPFCWRCETPLLNYATSSWFVAVEKIKKDLLAGNEKINWIPEHIRDGRFGKWLDGARDWAISRNRFWGAPLPIWRCEKCGELKCVSGKSELEKLSGEKVDDLHKHFVDEIEFDCEKCGAKMRRIPEVLDCWFESGSMPFAQFAEKSDATIPADFIAEAQDQTRGWFYTLHVLSTAIAGKSAFKNCVCSGLILAEDGAKMSKSKNNFPPPAEIFDKFGADAMRLYLMNSPVTHAADLRFSEKGVEEILRGILLPLWNTFYFFTTYSNADDWSPTRNSKLATRNSLDRWILSELNILVREMTENLEKFEIQKAVAPLEKFLDGLTNWFVRRSRRRFWKSESDADKNAAYSTLFAVLKTVAKLLAPITPFLAEKIWQNLTGGESVHLENWPEVDESRIDEKLSSEVSNLRKIIELGLKIRANEKIKVRQPLNEVMIVRNQEFSILGIDEAKKIICEELNVQKISLVAASSRIIEKKIAILNPRLVASRLSKQGLNFQDFLKAGKDGKFEEIESSSIPRIKIEGEIFEEDEFEIRPVGKEGSAIAFEGGLIVALDTEISAKLELEGRARDLVREIQNLRKTADFDVSDRIELQLENADEILAKWEKYISTEVLAEKVERKIDSPAAAGNLDEIKIGVRKI